LNWGNGVLNKFLMGFNIKDTQCGFKLFTHEAAKHLFPTQHLERWAFDLELMFLCNQKGIPVVEVPVHWQEIDGSHLNVIDATIQVFRDMILIKLLYTCRIWKITDMSF